MERIDAIRAVHASLHDAGRLCAMGLADGYVCPDAEVRLIRRLLELVGGSSRPEDARVEDAARPAIPARTKRVPRGRGTSFPAARRRVAVSDLPLPLVQQALRSLQGKGVMVGVVSLANRLHQRHGCEQYAPLALAGRLRQLGVPVESGPWPRIDLGRPAVRRLLGR